MHQSDARVVYRSEIFRFPENRREAVGLTPGAGSLDDLVNDDPPASDRESDEDHDDGLNDRSRPKQEPHHTQSAHTTHRFSEVPLSAAGAAHEGAGFEMTFFNPTRFYTAFASAK